jgi:hypothetical protein
MLSVKSFFSLAHLSVTALFVSGFSDAVICKSALFGTITCASAYEVTVVFPVGTIIFSANNEIAKKNKK